MIDRTHDTRVRAAAFAWLDKQKAIHGEELPHTLLQQGFMFEGTRVPLISPQGIFRPAILQEVPLSIRTAANGPYDDTFSTDNFLHYRYRGTDPNHRDNVGLRTAMVRRIPLIYEELLDAAHIIPDSHPDGEPVVSNGMALCHLHHTAFDKNFIGVRPDDYVLEVRPDILNESDGPTLKFAIQGLHNTRIFTPENQLLRPNPELIRVRYDQFRNGDRTA